MKYLMIICKELSTNGICIYTRAKVGILSLVILPQMSFIVNGDCAPQGLSVSLLVFPTLSFELSCLQFHLCSLCLQINNALVILGSFSTWIIYHLFGYWWKHKKWQLNVYSCGKKIVCHWQRVRFFQQEDVKLCLAQCILSFYSLIDCQWQIKWE